VRRLDGALFVVLSARQKPQWKAASSRRTPNLFLRLLVLSLFALVPTALAAQEVAQPKSSG
jgi:hypothetical protein